MSDNPTVVLTLIAERIMDWRVDSDRDPKTVTQQEVMQWNTLRSINPWVMVMPDDVGLWVLRGWRDGFIWNPFHFWDDAGKIVDAMSSARLNMNVHIVHYGYSRAYAWIGRGTPPDDEWREANGKNAVPEAITLAAYDVARSMNM